MSNDNDTVIRLCGEYPEGFEKLNLESNPDFVFTNDPAYEIVNLYDFDENTVSVKLLLSVNIMYLEGGIYLNKEMKLFITTLFLFIAVLLITIGTIYHL